MRWHVGEEIAQTYWVCVFGDLLPAAKVGTGLARHVQEGSDGDAIGPFFGTLAILEEPSEFVFGVSVLSPRRSFDEDVLRIGQSAAGDSKRQLQIGLLIAAVLRQLEEP
jgi:hypothetical protein